MGSVAAALKRLAIKAAEDSPEISGLSKEDKRSTRQGIGADKIAKYLVGIDGINIGTVQQDLASLYSKPKLVVVVFAPL